MLSLIGGPSSNPDISPNLTVSEDTGIPKFNILPVELLCFKVVLLRFFQSF